MVSLDIRWADSATQIAVQFMIMARHDIWAGICIVPGCARNAPGRLACGRADCRRWVDGLTPDRLDELTDWLEMKALGTLTPGPRIVYRPLATGGAL